jgi:hypothetical protein
MLKQRASLAKGQSPRATILTCSDSRVSPGLIFGGVGLGELFVARKAGNMADMAKMGTIEYGAEHLEIPLIVVLSHQNHDAVSAACEVVEKHTKLPGSIGPMVGGRWSMVGGRWSMVDGRWSMVDGRWSMQSCRSHRLSMANQGTVSTTRFARAPGEVSKSREP